jgi:hypothetical protein
MATVALLLFHPARHGSHRIQVRTIPTLHPFQWIEGAAFDLDLHGTFQSGVFHHHVEPYWRVLLGSAFV